eukprot:TRINITY_DN2820_c0_g1_i2.p1 TRINITY_DN2820_c0_g1~~TRINITY_DN2820_c0_g1_i2.p1  ORF type:complete len:553 (-),score=142.32 TRINITY_DN2820_c0_g1_i2:442-2100(-)
MDAQKVEELFCWGILKHLLKWVCLLQTNLFLTQVEERDSDNFLFDLLEALQDPETGISIKNRTWMLKKWKNCFVGKDMVIWLIEADYAQDVDEALAIGNDLLSRGLMSHVTGDHAFKNEDLFYRFAPGPEIDSARSRNVKSWTNKALEVIGGFDGEDILQPEFLELDEEMMVAADELEVSPLDKWNLQLLDNVHPSNWENPDPLHYNIVAIGAGAGGLITAAASAGVGARAALIEKHLLGGDCLNVGCVPSKALIKCAEEIHRVRESYNFGVNIDGDISVDFGAVMERMRRIRAEISVNDSARRFQEELNVDVYIGHATFTSKHSLEVGGQTIRFSKAVIATGARAAVPSIDGLQDVNYLTNSTIFNLTELPRRFGVIGTGAIGCEMAQTFARFGSEVTIFARSEGIMSREDPEAVSIVTEQFLKEGITILPTVTYEHIAENENGEILVVCQVDGEHQEFIFDQLLIATGRAPNVENMGLEAAKVKYNDRQGIRVSNTLQTSNGDIFAVGDCCSSYKFTHMADAMARIVVRNALFFGSDSGMILPFFFLLIF